MDFQESDGEYSDDQQGVNPSKFTGFLQPCDQLCHAPRRVKRRSRFEHNSYHFTGFIECTNIIGQRLVLAAMPFVLLTVAEKVAVKLFQMVFGDWYIGEVMEDGFHDFGIASHFLLIAAVKLLDFQLGKYMLDLAVS